MNRRNFLTSMLAACAAPAIVRADSLMRIMPRDATMLTEAQFISLLPPSDPLYGLFHGLQWTAAELEIMALRPRPPFAVNIIRNA